MADRFQSTLRREFIGLGLTGAMVGLAGCSDSVTVETESEDSTDEESDEEGERNVTLDTASFSFSYDDDAQQITIEFTGGADIRAGDLQIRQDGGKRVQWAELGSTTTGPDEVIDSGSTATLGPNILNWETAISAEDTIRLVYTSKETPATLERYSPPEDTDTNTTVPASISEFTLESRSEQRLHISFVADKQLETLEVGITGAESRTLQMSDFTESQTGSGSYLYEVTISVAAEGSYTATLEDAVDISGNDSTSGQRITAQTDLTTKTEDTTPPTIDAFSIANPADQRLRISFDSSEQLSTIRVSITGPETITLTQADFSVTETNSGQYRYEGTFEIDSSGDFRATLEQADDPNGNNGAKSQSVNISITGSPTLIKESFEEYATGGLPTNWSITQGSQAGTGVIAGNNVTPSPVDGEQMLSISWGDDSGEDTTVSGWPTESNKSYKPSKISFSIYDPIGRDTNAWHFKANSADGEKVLFIIGGNQERRFRYGTGNNEWVTIRDTYWSEGWHKVEFLNINWETNRTDIAIDGEIVQRDISFIDSEITNLEFRTRDFDRMDMLLDDIRIATNESQSDTNTELSTIFKDSFEDGEYENAWSIVWQNFGEREPTNKWSVTQNHSSSGNYSLYLDSNGDPNIVATNDRIIKLDRDFELTVKYHVPDSNNRGPSVRLLDSDKNGSQGNYIQAEEANFGRVANDSPPFGQNDLFQLFDNEASVSSSSLNEWHQIRVIREGDTIVGYHDGNEIISLQVDDIEWDLTNDYRLALRNSGRWGDDSEIYFDEVEYAADN